VVFRLRRPARFLRSKLLLMAVPAENSSPSENADYAISVLSQLSGAGLSKGRGIQGKAAQNRAASSKSKSLSCICCRQLILPITILRAPLFRRNGIELP
jgi:hypothetical protein